MQTLKNLIQKLHKTGFGFVFGSNVINKVITFLSSVIIVRVLTKSEYGFFTYAWNIYSIINLLNGLAMDSAVIQLSSEKSGDKEYTNKICNYATKVGLLVNLLLALIIMLVSWLAPMKYSSSKELLRLLSFLPFFYFGFSLCIAILRSRKANKQFAFLNSLNSILLILGSVCGSFLLREKGLVLSYYLSYTICLLVAFYYMHITLISREGEPICKEEKRTILSIGAISTCNNGLSQLLYLLDMFVLGFVVIDEKILASYKVSTQIPTALSFIPLSVMVYAYPYYAEHKDDKNWCIDTYKKTLIGMGFVNFSISLFLVVCAPFLINTIYGTQYNDAVICFRILSISYFISGTFRIISGNLLVTQRKLKFNLLETIVSSIVNIVGDVVLISLYGSVGAAVASLLVIIVSSIMSTAYLVYTFCHINENKLQINNL